MDFLQSNHWRKFQESIGRKAFYLEDNEISASIIEHKLPIVGKYFYIPRGLNYGKIANFENQNFFKKLIKLSKEKNEGWIRLDINTQRELKLFQNNTDLKIKKAPHDVQPKEIFVIDVSKAKDEILSGMKSKTRYNVRLSQKKGVKIKQGKKYLNDFLRLTKTMAKRQGINPHPDNYYQKMLEVIPSDILKLYVAEYKNKIIAADLVVFYDKTATYLHGASDNEHRNVMAPFFLKWQEILDAKEKGCVRFDFGGISANYKSNKNIRIANSWAGITRFKLGFSKSAQPIKFLGSYDIIINSKKYFLYKFIQKLKKFF